MKKKEEEKFDPESYNLSINDFNKQWRDYWEKEFEEQYKENNLVKQRKKDQELISLYMAELTKLANENDRLFQQNLQLGEQLETARFSMIEKIKQIKELQELAKPVTGLFNVANVILKQRKKNRQLEFENCNLKNQRLQITTAPPTPSVMQAIDNNVVDKILALRVQGKSCKEIAEITGVSVASVSRYANKPDNKKRISFMKEEISGLG